MKHIRHLTWFVGLVVATLLLGPANEVCAQERTAFSKEQQEQARRAIPQPPPAVLACRGPITQVIDVGHEGVKITSAVFGTSPGGGEGKEFDPTPLLSTKVNLAQGTCLDAHLSAIVGSKQSYPFVSRMTFFQVTLTRLGPALSSPVHLMGGHFETIFGLAPAVALEAERDVDMYASNFFQRVGTGPHEVTPGLYSVDVWWAGGPWFNPAPPPGGAIGAGFVLKLYLR